MALANAMVLAVDVEDPVLIEIVVDDHDAKLRNGLGSG